MSVTLADRARTRPDDLDSRERARDSAPDHPHRTSVFSSGELRRQIILGQVTVSPDGRFIVYSKRSIRNDRWRSELWLWSVDEARHRRLHLGSGSDYRPRISPDGTSVLFLKERRGTLQPWVAPIEGEGAHQLMASAQGVLSAEWSPEGQRVLLRLPSGRLRYLVAQGTHEVVRRITNLTWRAEGVGYRDRYVRAGVFDFRTEQLELVGPDDAEVHWAFWNSSGSEVGLVTDLSKTAEVTELPQLWMAGLGEPAALRQLAELPGGIWRATGWRDGSIAFVGVDTADAPWGQADGVAVPSGRPWTRNLQLFLSDESGSAPRCLGTDFDRPIMCATFGNLIEPVDWLVAPVWTVDGSILSLVSDEGAVHPYRFSRDGRAERLADGPFVCSSIASGGGTTVVVANRRGGAGEVELLYEAGFSPVTSSGGAWLRRCRRDPEPISVPRPDGGAVPGWAIRARPNGEHGPLVLHVHGGPHLAHGPVPRLEMLALADLGISVIYANPRGSMGYGEAHASAPRGAWGSVDAEDLLLILDWAVAAGIADATRIGVMGSSYGGFMVNWLLGHHPHRFAAGISENPVTDWVGLLGSSDLPSLLGPGHADLGSLPAALAKYPSMSPYLTIAETRTPLLVIQSADDLRCPPGQSELVFTLLRLLGRPVELLEYPHEGHIVHDPRRQEDRMERICDWFTRYLVGAIADA